MATFGVNANNQADYSSKSRSIKELAYKAFVVCHDSNILVEAWLPEQVQTDVSANYDAPFAQGVGGGDGMASKLLKLGGYSLTTQALTIQTWQGGSYINFSLQFIFQAEDGAAADVMTPIKNLKKLTMPVESAPGGLLISPGPRLDPKVLTGANAASVVKGIGQGAALAAYDGAVGAASLAGSTILDAVGSTGVGSSALDFFGAKNAMSDLNNKVASSVSSLVGDVNKALTPASSLLINNLINNISLYVGQFLYFDSVVVTDVSPTFDVVLGPDKNPMRASVNVSFRTLYIPTQSNLDTMYPSVATTGGGRGTINPPLVVPS